MAKVHFNLDKLTVPELSTLLGVGARQISLYKLDGMPSIGEGRGIRYLWRDVRDWYIKRKIREQDPRQSVVGRGDNRNSLVLTEEQARKYKAEADRAELKFKVESGELVEKVQVVRSISGMVAIIRNRLLALPVKITPLVAVNGNKAKVRALLDDEIRKVLLDLSESAGRLDFRSEKQLTDDAAD